MMISLVPSLESKLTPTRTFEKADSLKPKSSKQCNARSIAHEAYYQKQKTKNRIQNGLQAVV